MTTALTIRDLDVELGQRLVLDNVDLEVGQGELVGLIGPNGAGKTTLLRAVLGLLPFTGSVTVVDDSVIGYVPQRHEFAWDFPITVEAAVMTGRTSQIGWFRRPQEDDRRAVAEALSRAGMSELGTRPIGELSGGQRQRVLVARALAMRPAVLLLDEPFTGVDIPTQELLTKLIDELLADGCALLMTTHDLGAAARTSNRLCLLNRTVVASGSPEELSDPSVWLKAFGVDSSVDLISAITRQ